MAGGAALFVGGIRPPFLAPTFFSGSTATTLLFFSGMGPRDLSISAKTWPKVLSLMYEGILLTRCSSRVLSAWAFWVYDSRRLVDRCAISVWQASMSAAFSTFVRSFDGRSVIGCIVKIGEMTRSTGREVMLLEEVDFLS